MNTNTMNKRQEKILASKDAEAAYEYARDVIKDRWPEAEETISKSPFATNSYMDRFIKGRWPRAEESMALKYKSAGYFWHYTDIDFYVSKINWSDPVNDFPLPKRVKTALDRTLRKANA